MKPVLIDLQKQLRYMLTSLREAHHLYSIQHSANNIGLSKFCELHVHPSNVIPKFSDKNYYGQKNIVRAINPPPPPPPPEVAGNRGQFYFETF